MSLSGGWQCPRLISSGNMPRRPCVGPTNPKPKKNKQALIKTPRTWTQAAVQSERTVVVSFPQTLRRSIGPDVTRSAEPAGELRLRPTSRALGEPAGRTAPQAVTLRQSLTSCQTALRRRVSSLADKFVSAHFRDSFGQFPFAHGNSFANRLNGGFFISFVRKEIRTIRGFPSESKLVTRMFHPAGIPSLGVRASMEGVIHQPVARHDVGWDAPARRLHAGRRAAHRGCPGGRPRARRAHLRRGGGGDPLRGLGVTEHKYGSEVVRLTATWRS